MLRQINVNDLKYLTREKKGVAAPFVGNFKCVMFRCVHLLAPSAHCPFVLPAPHHHQHHTLRREGSFPGVIVLVAAEERAIEKEEA